jgi:hypothetical protein
MLNGLGCQGSAPARRSYRALTRGGVPRSRTPDLLIGIPGSIGHLAVRLPWATQRVLRSVIAFDGLLRGGYISTNLPEHGLGATP